MALFCPSPAAAKLLAQEFAERDLTAYDLLEQVLTRIALENTIRGTSAHISPRRVVRTIFAIALARRRSGLRQYSARVTNAVTWLLTREEQQGNWTISQTPCDGGCFFGWDCGDDHGMSS